MARDHGEVFDVDTVRRLQAILSVESKLYQISVWVQHLVNYSIGVLLARRSEDADVIVLLGRLPQTLPGKGPHIDASVDRGTTAHFDRHWLCIGCQKFLFRLIETVDQRFIKVEDQQLVLLMGGGGG